MSTEALFFTKAEIDAQKNAWMNEGLEEKASDLTEDEEETVSLLL